MPAALPVSVSDIFQFRMKGTLNNQATISQFNYRVMALAGVHAPNELADAINARMIIAGGVAFEALPCLPSNWTGANTECQRVYDKRDRSVIRTDVWAPSGTGNVANTSNLAQAITRRTDNAGRKQVSDLHLPVSTATATIINGVLSAAQVALMNTYRIALSVQFVLLGGDITIAPVIWHSKDANPASNWDVITSTFVQPTVRTMRRRGVGLGI